MDIKVTLMTESSRTDLTNKWFFFRVGSHVSDIIVSFSKSFGTLFAGETVWPFGEKMREVWCTQANKC